jgi:23S rRNA (cytidine1920-2'-O)/16S rRNA (cytidine1409-2'-O)-methyltransferase
MAKRSRSTAGPHPNPLPEGEGIKPFVSRAGLKLDHALSHFDLAVTGKTCADFGSNTGGFVDCLLRRGAARIYAIDTGYGALDWKLRNDPRVIVMERTNAIHVSLPAPVQLVTIDVAWTKQRVILPPAMRVLAPDGQVVTLIKPHYEAPPKLLRKGVLPADELPGILKKVNNDIRATGFEIVGSVPSPIKGAKGNVEMLAHLVRARPAG